MTMIGLDPHKQTHTAVAIDDQFASYNGTAPIEAPSGGKVRHRLNPRGNRNINHALHIAAVCQLRYEGEGRTYYDRKNAEANRPRKQSER